MDYNTDPKKSVPTGLFNRKRPGRRAKIRARGSNREGIRTKS